MTKREKTFGRRRRVKAREKEREDSKIRIIDRGKAL